MNIGNTLLVASLLAIGLVGSANAATTAKPKATQARCDELITQFDAAKASHSSDKGYTKAIAARETGAGECKAGKYQEGVAKLSAALHDIGVKPLTHQS